jgi:hypothetical protein
MKGSKLKVYDKGDADGYGVVVGIEFRVRIQGLGLRVQG